MVVLVPCKPFQRLIFITVTRKYYLLTSLLACLLASVVDDASFEEKPEFIHFLKENFFKLFLGFVFFGFFFSLVGVLVEFIEYLCCGFAAAAAVVFSG